MEIQYARRRDFDPARPFPGGLKMARAGSAVGFSPSQDPERQILEDPLASADWAVEFYFAARGLHLVTPAEKDYSSQAPLADPRPAGGDVGGPGRRAVVFGRSALRRPW